MIRTVGVLFGMIALARVAGAAEKKVQMKDLPPAVQKTVQAQLQGAEVRGISQETEDGVAQYEIETMLNGKHRDFNVDTKGTLLVVEEETSIDKIPAAAKAGILKQVGAGRLRTVETMTKGSSTFYEAGYTSKDGKRHEVLVRPDGSVTKE